MGTLNQFLKAVLPEPIVQRIRLHKNRDYNGLSLEDVFTKIYATRAWSYWQDDLYFSGSGSQRPEELMAYVDSVSSFFSSLPTKPDVVDLGCGDFTIGSHIRPFCEHYVACDIVRGLIEFNRKRFPTVDFRALDVTKDDLPLGDVALVRQVLQHLSNDQIGAFLDRLPKYKYLILTEHVPDAATTFKANVDKPAGPGTRVGYPSAVVLTAPPFNLYPKSEKELCRVISVDGGILVTTLYEMP